VLATVASADEKPCDPSGSWSACLGAKNGKIKIGATGRRLDKTTPPTGVRNRVPEESPLDAFCRDATTNATSSASSELLELCRGFAGAAVVAAPSVDQVRRAFRELPLYRGQIRSDPETMTLVNLETYFWCGDDAGRDCAALGQGERTVTLLGQPVRIRPRIVEHRWDFGDGQGSAGTRAAHTYRHATTATVTLTLTWTADYALPGGGFQPVDDTTTTTSPPRSLPVREAQAVLVR
jgi:hypothetical protein